MRRSLYQSPPPSELAEIDSVLQTTVNEVGRALNLQHCALRVEGGADEQALTNCYFRDGAGTDSAEETELMGDLDAYSVRLAGRFKNYVVDGRGNTDEQGQSIRPLAVVPLIYHERFMGVLLVRSDDPTRIWQENEVLLLRTVADQVTVAVNHARLYAQMAKQALTDGLTGCFNRRSFEMQLERDMHLATRMRQPISLILLDIEHFKRVNDTYGHDVGDIALRMLANGLREELRGVDTAARYGGEEFAVILPQAGLEGAVAVAERLRAHIEQTEVPGVGRITASFGVATFPLHATSRDGLVATADRALYSAKHSGRNLVCSPPECDTTLTDDMFDLMRAHHGRCRAEAATSRTARLSLDERACHFYLPFPLPLSLTITIRHTQQPLPRLASATKIAHDSYKARLFFWCGENCGFRFFRLCTIYENSLVTSGLIKNLSSSAFSVLSLRSSSVS